MRKFRIELAECELGVLRGALSNEYPGSGNEILNHISEGIENALSERPIYDGKVKELQTITQWCIIFQIRLLDKSYYDDKKLYTAKEFEEKIPRNIQV